ncbi:very short patch repair endonuclease [Rhodanobacter sp. PCA2]|nr:very short patch repair endonuclease [Rhodanobacter sp. PCA2]
MMRAVGRRDTKPELLFRSAAHRRGFRFCICRKDLPGCPDVVFPRLRLAVFVHGCFWHRHPSCPRATTPTTNQRFWSDKFDANVARDRRNRKLLEQRGWAVIEVWECELATLESAFRVVDKLLPRAY